MAVETLKILAIEDNPDDLVALAAVVQDVMPEAMFVTAHSGLRGIALARDEDPDVILLDIGAAELDGYAVCRALKADDRLRSIPVVFFTERSAGRESRLRALEAGAEGFLAKPPDAVELLAQTRSMAKIKAANRMQRHERELERELERERSDSQAILDMAPVMIACKSKDDHFVKVNSAFAEFVGLPKDKIIGMTTFDLVAQREVAQQGRDHDLEVMRTGIPLVSQLVKWSGFASQKEIWALYSKMPFSDSDGGIAGTVSFVVDVDARVRAEAALRESEDKFKYVFDHSVVGKSITLPSGEIAVNQALCDMLGYTAEELKGRKWQDITHPDDVELTQGAVRALMAGEAASQRFIKRYFHKDGSVVWVDFSSSLRRDEAGRPLYFVTTLSDITERKRAEEALRESEERYRLLVETSPDGIGMVSLDGRLLLANQHAAALFGFADPAEMVGADLFGYFAPEGREAAMAGIESVLQHGATLEAEYLMLRRDGTSFLGSLSGALVTDAGGAPRAIIGQIRDISERKRVEAELNRTNRLLDAIIENIPNMIFLKEAKDLRFARMNRAGESLLGTSREDLLGKNDYALFPREEAEFFIEKDRQVLKEKGVVDIPVEAIQTRLQGRRLLHTKKVAILDVNGEPEYLLGISEDITERKQAEDKLHESHDMIVKLTAQVPGVVYQYRLYADGRSAFPFASPGMNTIYEVSPEEVREDATPVFGRLHPEDYDRIVDSIQESARTLQPFHIEFRVVLPRQGLRWRLSDAIPERTEDGGTLWYGIISDVTERKLAEEALRESEARLLAILDATPFPIALVDVQDSNVGFWSRSALTLFGHTAPTAAEWYRMAYPDPDYRREVLNRWKPAVERARLTSQAVNAGEYRVTCRDGSVRICELYAAFCAERLIITFSDLTERKRAEAERERLLAQVQAQAQQIAQLMDTVPEGVLLLDEDGWVLLANPVAVRELATLAGVAVGERLTHLGEVSLTDLWAAAARGELWREIHVGRRILEVIARPVSTDQGAAVGHWVVVINDVTQTRDLRDQLQQQERLAAVGQLAAGIAHDFNNILAVIALQAAIVARSSVLAEHDVERLTTISEQTEHATRLIQQLLDFSRRAVLERRPLDLEPLLKEQVKLLGRTLPETIRVTLECEPGEYVVLADATRLQQMLMNLAVNARDAMPWGGTLRLTLARQETAPRPDLPARPWVRLELADSGTGISPETLPHLFEPFFTTKPARGQGSGLGLAQVHGIVKQHDGEIDVASAIGRGTTFTIYLPAVAETADVPAPVAIEPQAGDAQMLLIVEDNPALLVALSDTVEMLGYRAVGVTNGVEALAMLAERGDAISLVMSDLVMPVMGGEALFRAMRAHGYTTPVVMLSGHPLEGELAELKTQGLAGWLLKPPHLDDLARLLAQAMASSE